MDLEMNAAKNVYDTMCSKLDNMGWVYEKEEEKLLIRSGAKSNDLPIEFVVIVEPERQLVRFISMLPFFIPEEKRIEAAAAVCVANFDMADGCFVYDIGTGDIIFRMTSSFMDSTLGGDLFEYMIVVGCGIVDRYNDRFFALGEGLISLEDFISEQAK